MPSAEPLDTRDRLLEAAASMMWERSFQAAGVDELCQRAQAKKGSFYHFFPSKIDLAIAAIERSWVQVRETILEPTFKDSVSGLSQLQAFVDKACQFQLNAVAEKGAFLGCPFGNLGQEMARQDERIRLTLQKIFDAHCDYIEAALVRAQQEGEIPVGDNRQRAKNILAQLEGAQLLAKVANDLQVFRSIMSTVMVIAAA